MHDPNGKKITQKQKIANKSHKVIAGRSDIQTNTIPGRRIWELFPKLEVSAVLVSRPARRTVPTRPLHITSPVRPTHFGMVVNMTDALGGEMVDIFPKNFGTTFLHEFYESSAASQSFKIQLQPMGNEQRWTLLSIGWS